MLPYALEEGDRLFLCLSSVADGQPAGSSHLEKALYRK